MLMAELAVGTGEVVGVGERGPASIIGLVTVGDARVGGGKRRVLTEKVKPFPNLSDYSREERGRRYRQRVGE